jgi:predicted DNA-binding antitoxin AbrB/MazE fold protein
VSKTVKARFRNGVIEPLEKVELKEGEEFTLTIVRLPEIKGERDAFKESRGGWKGLIDCEELKRNIYNDRLIHTRAEVKL